jgi:hypothetical protein
MKESLEQMTKPFEAHQRRSLVKSHSLACKCDITFMQKNTVLLVSGQKTFSCDLCLIDSPV